MKKDRDEFNKAFMEGDQTDPPMMDDTTTDAAMDPAMSAGTEGERNAPTMDAAEGAPTPTGGDASAVMLADGADPGATIEDAKPDVDYEQKYKTLQGKYNAEVQRLKDEIAALKAGEDAPMMAKDGAKVDDADTSAGVMMKDDAGASRTADLFNDAPKARMADGGEVEGEGAMSGGDVMAMLEEDYGPEFVQAMAKLIDQRARQIVEEMGGEFAGGIEEKIEKIVEMSAQGLGRLHRSVLIAMRRDAEDVANSDEFTAWVKSLPEAERAQAETVIAEGELPELLALFEQYDGREGEAESPEDVWAEGAAAGVKGSAPIRIPTRAPASDDDEYKRAWDAM